MVSIGWAGECVGSSTSVVDAPPCEEIPDVVGYGSPDSSGFGTGGMI